MSSRISNALNGVGNVGAAASGAATSAATLAGDLANPLRFRDQLRPASWRGISFAVRSSDGRFGRRNAVHTYPFRDDVWVEDMGRQARRVNLTGFLVGEDVIDQREQLIAACEAPGDGELVHPTLGRLKLSLLEFSTSERWDQGRVFEIRFSFIESGQRIFPMAATSDQQTAAANADAAHASALAAYASKAAGYLKQGAAAVDAVVSTATKWAGIAEKVVQDATSLYNTVASLPGTLGRFANQALTGFATGPISQPSSITLDSLKGAANLARVNLMALSTDMLAQGGHPSSFGGSAQGIAAQVRASVADPRAAIGMLRSLSEFPSVAPAQSSPLGTARSGIQNSACDLFRRAAVVEMALAAIEYRPASADAAAAVRGLVRDALQAEMTIAGDQGEDDVFASLQTLFVTVSQSLAAKGAALPEVVTITSNVPLPALVLAQRLYQDIGRTDELVIEANPIHPAFMPVSFKGLSR